MSATPPIDENELVNYIPSLQRNAYYIGSIFEFDTYENIISRINDIANENFVKFPLGVIKVSEFIQISTPPFYRAHTKVDFLNNLIKNFTLEDLKKFSSIKKLSLSIYFV